MKNSKFITFYDKIIIICLIIISLLFTLGNLNSEYEHLTVIVEVNGSLYGEYSLDESKIIDISSEFGYNKVKISSNKVEVIKTSCPDKYELCDTISKSGQSIVCLPNRMIIRIAGKDKIDGVTY